MDYYQAVKKPSRTCSSSLPYQETSKTGFCGISEFLLLERMRWCCRDGGLLGKALNPPVIQTVPGSVESPRDQPAQWRSRTLASLYFGTSTCQDKFLWRAKPLFRICNNNWIEKSQTNSAAMKTTVCCIPCCTSVTCFDMMVYSSFDPFRSSWEGGKRRKSPRRSCGAFCWSSRVSAEWSFAINWFFKRHSCHYEWSSDSEGRLASQTR